jgi:RNA polymerase sigma factor (sigma-70 family)
MPTDTYSSVLCFEPSENNAPEPCEGHEELLVARARIGDAHAFMELRNLHSQRVYKTAYAVTRNREDAEDAAQETFLRAFTAVKKFEGRSSFSTWLTRIAINSSLMILRKRRTRPELSLNYLTELEGGREQYQIPDPSPSPEENYARNQRSTILGQAVSGLRPILRDVLEIQLMQGCSLRQTARVLEISEAAAKSRLLRARAGLRKSAKVQATAPSTFGPTRRNSIKRDSPAAIDTTVLRQSLLYARQFQTAQQRPTIS